MTKLIIHNKYFCFLTILKQGIKEKLSKLGGIIMIHNLVLIKLRAM